MTKLKRIEPALLAIIDEPLFISEATTAEELAYGTKLARANGFEYISDANNDVYQILTIEPIEESNEPDEGEPCIDDECPDYCVNCHNLSLIDGVINNTLRGTEPITPQQADTLMKLGQLKHLLGGM